MSKLIPGLTAGVDSVTVGFGYWHGNLDGSDTVNFTQNVAFTVTGASGGDFITTNSHDVQASITLGGGNDTVSFSSGNATVSLGGGNVSIDTGDGEFKVFGGDGNDTIGVESGSFT